MSKLIRKIFPSAIRAVDSERKIVETVMSDETLDRYDEVIQASAYKKTLKSFMRHPVLLSSHDYGNLRSQIGEWQKVWIEKNQLIGRAKYYYGEGNPEADWGFKLAERGIAAFSVGFIDIDSESVDWETYMKAKEDGKRIARRTYKEVDLLETSQVVVPANPAALQKSLEDQNDMYHDLAMKMKSKFIDSELEALFKGPSEIATKFMIQVHLPEVIDHTDDDTFTSKTVNDEPAAPAEPAVEVHKEAEPPAVEKVTEEVQMNEEQIKNIVTLALEPVKAEFKQMIDDFRAEVQKSFDGVITGMNLKTVLPEGTYIEGVVENTDEPPVEGKSATADLDAIMKGLGEIDAKLR